MITATVVIMVYYQKITYDDNVEISAKSVAEDFKKEFNNEFNKEYNKYPSLVNFYNRWKRKFFV